MFKYVLLIILILNFQFATSQVLANPPEDHGYRDLQDYVQSIKKVVERARSESKAHLARAEPWLSSTLSSELKYKKRMRNFSLMSASLLPLGVLFGFGWIVLKDYPGLIGLVALTVAGVSGVFVVGIPFFGLLLSPMDSNTLRSEWLGNFLRRKLKTEDFRWKFIDGPFSQLGQKIAKFRGQAFNLEALIDITHLLSELLLLNEAKMRDEYAHLSDRALMKKGTLPKFMYESETVQYVMLSEYYEMLASQAEMLQEALEHFSLAAKLGIRSFEGVEACKNAIEAVVLMRQKNSLRPTD